MTPLTGAEALEKKMRPAAQKGVDCHSIPELKIHGAAEALRRSVQGDDMKVATLVAAIFSALELLVQAFNLSLNFIHPQLNFQAVSIVEGMVFLLFTASLCCFFLVLYTKQQS